MAIKLSRVPPIPIKEITPKWWKNRLLRRL
jgi:hypothetical protein